MKGFCKSQILLSSGMVPNKKDKVRVGLEPTPSYRVTTLPKAVFIPAYAIWLYLYCKKNRTPTYMCFVVFRKA